MSVLRTILVRTAAGVVLALAVSLAGTGAQPVHAALDGNGLKDDGRWVFKGTDFTDAQATKENDPISMLWMGGRYEGASNETSGNIQGLLFFLWRYGDMRRHGCLEIKGQSKRLYMHLYPGNEIRRDGTDLTMSTSGGCKNQWHTRLWNDKEINGNSPSDAKWIVGGIHREKKRNFASKHRLSQSFEEAEQKALKSLDRLCSIPNWRALPGSGPRYFTRKYGRFYSNGKISRISMTPRSSPGGCRGAYR